MINILSSFILFSLLDRILIFFEDKCDELSDAAREEVEEEFSERGVEFSDEDLDSPREEDEGFIEGKGSDEEKSSEELVATSPSQEKLPIPEGYVFFVLSPKNKFRVFCYNFINHTIISNFLLCCILISSASLAAEVGDIFKLILR